MELEEVSKIFTELLEIAQKATDKYFQNCPVEVKAQAVVGFLNALVSLYLSLKGERAAVKEPLRPTGLEKPSAIRVLLDQTYPGLAERLAVLKPEVEWHEVVGLGVEQDVKIKNVWKHRAEDDYDVMRLVEKLSKDGKLVFISGDKKLTESIAYMVGAKELNVTVKYMPPTQYPGRENLIQAIMAEVVNISEKC